MYLCVCVCVCEWMERNGCIPFVARWLVWSLTRSPSDRLTNLMTCAWSRKFFWEHVRLIKFTMTTAIDMFPPDFAAFHCKTHSHGCVSRDRAQNHKNEDFLRNGFIVASSAEQLPPILENANGVHVKGKWKNLFYWHVAWNMFVIMSVWPRGRRDNSNSMVVRHFAAISKLHLAARTASKAILK